jgi:alanyl-tRNA synthetase
VQIPGVDSCACCGVHTATTGQVGLIKLFNCVKFHGGARIEMACGKRALELMNLYYEENRQVSQAFSAKATQTGAAARHMNEQLSNEKFRANNLQRQIFALKAKEYAGQTLAVCFEEECQSAQVRAFAEELAQVCQVGAVFSEDGKGGYNLCLAGDTEQVKAIGAALAKNLGARGGGKPGFYQGSVVAARENIQAVLQTDCP